MQIARQIWSSSHIENCPKCKAAVQGEVVWNAWENEKCSMYTSICMGR